MSIRTAHASPAHPYAAARSLGLAIVCALLGSSAACGSSRPETSTPEQTVVALSRALSEGKLDVAYALMSPEYRKRVSFETWQKSLGANSQEVTEVSSDLTHLRGEARHESVVLYGDDSELRLVKDGEHWYVMTEIARFYDQSTPRAALHAFVRALQRRRFDVLLRLVPNADKEGMTTERMEAAWSGQARTEADALVASLDAHLDAPIEEVGNRATMPYGDRMRVSFVREDGAWKIVDPK